MSQLDLLRERRFAPLFWTQFLGALNDNFFKTALVLLMTYGVLSERHEAAVWVPVLNGLLILPFFLFSSTAGQLADKFERSRLVRWIKVWEVGVMLVAAVGLFFTSAWLLAVALFMMGTQSAFFGPVKYAVLPQALRDHELIAGNALVGTGTFLAILVGTIAGGILMGWGFRAPIVASLAIAVAVFGWLTSRRIPEAAAPSPELRLDWNPLRTTRTACRYAGENRTVFHSILGISWFWFFGATLLTLLPSYGRDVLRVDETVATSFLVVFCLGIGVGAVLCERVARHKLELGLVPAGAFGLSLFTFDLFLATLRFEPTTGAELASVGAFFASDGSVRIAFDLFAIAVLGGLYIVPLNALVQRSSDPEKRSRILSAGGILSALFMVGSSVMTTAYGALGIPSVVTYLVLGVLNLVVALYIIRLVPDLPLRLLTWLTVRAAFRLRVRGHENVPEDGPVLLAANHVTYVDSLILVAALERPVRFVMYYKFEEWPLVGSMARRHGVIPICGYHENPGVLKSALDAIAEALEAGEVVCIFPEGSLTQDGDLMEFKRGIERIVQRTPVPVTPVGLQGLWGTLFSLGGRGPFGLLPPRIWSRVRVKIGAPIEAEEVSIGVVRDRVAALRGAAA